MNINESKSPTTDEAIARQGAEEIMALNYPKTPAIDNYTAIILGAIQRARISTPSPSQDTEARERVLELSKDINGILEECGKHITLSNDFPWAEEVHCALHSLEQKIEVLTKERDAACQVIRDLQLGPPGSKSISTEMKAGIEQMEHEAQDRAARNSPSSHRREIR